MTLLVVGSVGLDDVQTPFGHREGAIGGSASYFSISASYFSDVKLVATVGSDFPESAVTRLRERGVDLEGLQQEEGKTFRWEGRYGFDLNEAETIKTELNVFSDFNPQLPENYLGSDFVFLANIDPILQLRVLDQIKSPRFVGCDTMNYWIQGKKNDLLKTLSKIDLLAINESEARLLSGESNVPKAAQAILKMGPSYVVIKRGEYGALLFGPEDIFFAPAFPLEDVYDPTGAGDSFAGGLMGYLAYKTNAGEEISNEVLREATVMGCVMASFNVGCFSYDGMLNLSDALISQRFQAFRRLVETMDSAPLHFK